MGMIVDAADKYNLFFCKLKERGALLATLSALNKLNGKEYKHEIITPSAYC